MKLFFDARYINVEYHDGISRYTTELGNALARLTPVTFLICEKEQVKFLPKNAEFLLIHPITSIKEPFTGLILNKYRPDVVISPLQTMGSIGRQFKLILTLHDLIYYKHRTPPPQYSHILRLGWRLYHLSYIPQRMTLNNADIIATVSEASKKEIIKARLTKRPVIVIPNAARDLHQYLEKPIVMSTHPPKNLVYMGAFIPYKNVETLIRSMEFMKDRKLHLLSRIQPARKAQLMKFVPRGADVTFHGGVTDQQYAHLLADDAIMVSASKAEGYGLPLAEALKLGVPAVVSDMDIFREVAGEGALYANPEDPQSFANQICELDNISIRKALVAEGKKHIEQYSWEESARSLLSAINKIV